MKLLFKTFLILLCLTGVVSADSFDDYNAHTLSQCSDYQVTRVSVTDTNSSVTFTRDTKAIFIENLGSTNEVWIDLDDSVATAGSSDEFRLDAGKNRALSGFKTRSIGLIASTGESTTVQVESCI